MNEFLIFLIILAGIALIGGIMQMIFNYKTAQLETNNKLKKETK